MLQSYLPAIVFLAFGITLGGVFAMVETPVFMGLLAIAFLCVWRRGALEWR